MIREITIKGVATYSEDEQKLENLGKINFVFGSNGSGKTTISRILASPERYPSCAVNWENDVVLCTRVYNADFIDENFKSDDSIPGIFTLGSEENGIKQKIDCINGCIEKVSRMQLEEQKTMEMNEKELSRIREECEKEVWKEGKKYFGGSLKSVFRGYMGSMASFMEAVERYKPRGDGQSNNQDTLEKLQQLGDRVFSKELMEVKPIVVDEYKRILDELRSIAENPLLNKRIVGKENLNISGLIERLGNSDWVKKGREYLHQSEGVCPFCQQKLTRDLGRELEEYFGHEYENDLKNLSGICEKYRERVESLLRLSARFCEPQLIDIDCEKITYLIDGLKKLFEKNNVLLDTKREEPSKIVVLDWDEKLVADYIHEVENESSAVRHHNDIVFNIANERKEVAERVWDSLETRTRKYINNYKKRKAKIEKENNSLKKRIEGENKWMTGKKLLLQELNAKITNVNWTKDYINGLLARFGFTGFRIEVNEKKKEYYLARDNGEQIQKTLSEGEKSFITFLYFLALLKGSKESSGAVTPQVVVIDDPVSSLDNEILFIVSLLIRDLYNEIVKGNGTIKQVLVLSHNLYFYKEVTFKQSCGRKIEKELNHHWVVRKRNGKSTIEFHEENPIKSTYEILWSDVREATKFPEKVNSNSLQNTMRRILEHYYKYYGDVSLNRLPENVGVENRFIVKELLLWANDGSHASFDDICYAPLEERSVERYLSAFRLIFDKMGHLQHYNMMMKIESGDEI